MSAGRALAANAMRSAATRADSSPILGPRAPSASSTARTVSRRRWNRKREVRHHRDPLPARRPKPGHAMRVQWAPMPNNDPIRHVVHLMMENRSFDQMLGGLQVEIPEI